MCSVKIGKNSQKFWQIITQGYFFIRKKTKIRNKKESKISNQPIKKSKNKKTRQSMDEYRRIIEKRRKWFDDNCQIEVLTKQLETYLMGLF